ncbi:MAG: hypothetical protein JW843_06885 [Candidatus Aminicenantes bacterium]|nr:hypothetical protein [Candidatus Aminicenantes bacterium]
MFKRQSRPVSSLVFLGAFAALVISGAACKSGAQGSALTGPRFSISFAPQLTDQALDGRMLLMLSNSDKGEPRFQVGDGALTQLIFGIDVEGMAPGAAAVIDASVFGYPLKSLADVPPGDYYVQALLNRYETFVRADGHSVKLPPDKGEGQAWNRKPGNFYSEPKKIAIAAGQPVVFDIVLDKEIPPIAPPADTKYIKHVKIQSELLTKFWGRPMELGACVLLPEGFEEHPNARYPLIVNHGHFPYTLEGFRETPPDPDLKPDYSERFHLEGYNHVQQEYAYQFYKDWTGPNFPRVIVIEIQHANPYYDDSYAVNSANLGPYGDAIVKELIPYIEEKFRGLGAGWARFMYGGSTGGWEALAAQVLYPDDFNGCYAACPDPIDFRAYTVVDIYSHKNAYYIDSPWKKTPRPGMRNYLGEVATTLEQANHLEAVLASKGRSGGQWDIWQAVYSPVGADGYPKPIWDKMTGVIDPETAAYWRENYDIGYILQRDWKTLGPKLQGKIHIYVGDMDNYYLNNAVYLVEAFLESTKDPYYAGEVKYGDRAEHCWNGDPKLDNAYSRLRYHQMYIPKAIQRLLRTAPIGADLKSWRY